LIRPNDDKFLDAFYFALKNTLVTKNIDQATHIAYNLGRRYRVVTLDGELIELSGTIAGGGKPRSGGMSSTVV
jgi:structural maintenance of chromosome 4